MDRTRLIIAKKQVPIVNLAAWRKGIALDYDLGCDQEIAGSNPAAVNYRFLTYLLEEAKYMDHLYLFQALTTFWKKEQVLAGSSPVKVRRYF